MPDGVASLRTAGTTRAHAVLRMCLAESLGTYLLVLFGCGVVHSAVLTGAQSGLWQVAVVWGLAIMLAIYVTGAVSGAHINPAMTLAFAARGRFSWSMVPPYIASQLIGAFAAAATLFVLFGAFLAAREQEKNVVRGNPGSEITAMCYGEYFPSPGPLANSPGPYSEEAHKQLNSMVSERVAFFAEALGTLILALVVFAVTDQRNSAAPPARLAPVFIGLTVSALISVIAPLTQACFNPARDIGPRAFAYIAGWGAVAIPGPSPTGFLTVYILAPVGGAIAGAAIHDLLMRPALAVPCASPKSTKLQERREMTTRLILVGGFLGAGKTTLLTQATVRLARQGRRVGLVANDQAADLVDVELLREAGSQVEEVAGGCFCCRFPDLLGALGQLATTSQPDVVLCEPVGSCTDLSATVIQPMKKLHGDRFRVAPFTVLVDPIRAREALSEGLPICFPGNVTYIFRKQLEEADAIVLNKSDAMSRAELAAVRQMLAERFPGKPLLAMSALDGEGVDAWLRLVEHDSPAGQVIAEVDYDVYAEGEAALGWLNARVELETAVSADWAAFCRALLEGIQAESRAIAAEVAHLKLHLTAGQGTLTANLTSSGGVPLVRGTLRTNTPEAVLLVNARVHMEPGVLRAIIERCLAATAGDAIRVKVDHLQSFAPARPRPTHRFTAVV